MTSVIRKVKVLFHWLKNKLVQLNLFDSDHCRSGPFHLGTAIISTRIYIVLLVTIITILIVTSVLSDRTESITIRNPPQSIYEDLLNKYSTTLSCRCRQTAIPFATFTTVSVQHHPICSSIFISDHWINLLFDYNIAYYFQLDFRSLASGHFQLLSSFCKLAKQTVRDTLDDFLSSTLLSVNVLSPQSLKIQSQMQSMFMWKSSSDTVSRLVQLIQDTTHSNQLQTARQTTGLNRLYIFPDGQLGSGIKAGCYVLSDEKIPCCCSSQHCWTPSAFFDLYAYETNGLFISQNSSIANISGLMGGCYAVESLLRSTLECLFDRECVDDLLRFFPRVITSDIDILLINQTKFSPKTLIKTLIDELLVEQWLTKSSFPDYYNQCVPIACTYTSVRRNNILNDLITLIGLYGGVIVILRLCVPHLIKWWRRRAMVIHRRLSLMDTFRAAYRRIKVKMMELNLYTINGMDTNPYDMTTARIATRIYLLFLVLSITHLIIFTSLQTQIGSVTIENPSEEMFEYLQEKYSSRLQCPCTEIAINYGSFVSLSPKYHPVCSSGYVSTEWINSIEGTLNNDSLYYYDDFHLTGKGFFSTVSVLCSTAQSTLSGGWFIFNHSTFITDHAIPQRELMIRTNAVLDQFESSTIDEFKRLFSLIRLHTKTMFSAKRSNVDLYTRQMIDDIEKGERIDFRSVTLRYGVDCLCGLTDECGEQVWMYSNGNSDLYEKMFLIPNFFIGCFTIQSALQSSLECFFNQTCLDAVQYEIISESSIDISILQQNATQFSPETSIGTLMNSLMIEEWGRRIRYDEYYNQCAPKLCSYATFYRKNIFYILTKLISLIGGLTIALKIVVSVMVKWLRKRRRPTNDNNPPQARPILKDRIRAGWSRLKTKIEQLNIFTNELTVDVHRRYGGIIATRLYFLFLILSLTILIIYTSVEMQTRHITVSRPSQIEFEHLQSNPHYVSTLDCRCRHISIRYDTFISIQPQLHQLCDSDFARESFRWMSVIYHPMASLNYSYNDFRAFIVPEFQSLFSFCTLANETLTDALILFMSNTFGSVHVQTRETIEKHLNESLVRFRLSTPRTFVRLLDYVREIAQGNGIVSSISSNWHFISLNKSGQDHSLWAEPRSYGDDCSCGTNARCTSPAFIDQWRVPGFLVGCYPLEALLQSTLECLYDITCINKLKTLYYDMNITIRPLDPLLSSPHATVQSLLNSLLIDRWESKMIYEEYYAACEPLSCTYLITERANLLLIMNTIVGLFGGLSVVLKLIAPALVIIAQHLRMRRRRRIQMAVSVIAIPQ